MATSKTIAALLGPTLVASAVSLLANLATSQALIDELSQSPTLIMIAGYAAFVPDLAIVYFHNRWTRGWPVLVTGRSLRRKRYSCRCDRILGYRSVPFVQGICSRVTAA